MRNWLLTIERPLPRNGGKARLVICTGCQYPRCALYPWRLDPSRRHAVFISRSWQCRSCAKLRYASEGGALLHRPRTAFGKMLAAVENFTRHDRPEPFYPYVFANPSDVKTRSFRMTGGLRTY